MAEYNYTNLELLEILKDKTHHLTEDDIIIVSQTISKDKNESNFLVITNRTSSESSNKNEDILKYKVLNNKYFETNFLESYEALDKDYAYILLDKFIITEKIIPFPINFNRWIFLESVNISHVVFSSITSFCYTYIFKECLFENNIFLDDTKFEPSFFYDNAHFNNNTFYKPTSFSMSHFKKECHFENCVFKEVAAFCNIFFFDKTYFYFVIFENKSVFMMSCFFNITHFLLNDFEQESNFESSFFIGKVHFQKVNFNICSMINTVCFDYLIFDNIQVENKLCMRISEEKMLNEAIKEIVAYILKNDLRILINLPIDFNMKVDFDKIKTKGIIEIINYSLVNSFFKDSDMCCFYFFNVKWPIKNKRIVFNDERADLYSHFEDICMQLKTKYHSMQNNILSDLFYASELEMRRKNKVSTSKLPLFLKFINLEGLYYIISKYGLSWLSPLVFVIIFYIIFLVAFSFNYFPAFNVNQSTLDYGVIKNTSALLLKNILFAVDNSFINNFVNNGYSWFAFFLKLHQIVSYFLLVMSGFAIKRKFINK